MGHCLIQREGVLADSEGRDVKSEGGRLLYLEGWVLYGPEGGDTVTF